MFITITENSAKLLLKYRAVAMACTANKIAYTAWLLTKHYLSLQRDFVAHGFL